MSQLLNLVGKPEKLPAHLSTVALTFEAEIKRMAAEKRLSIEKVMRKLAEFSGVSEGHLYNYRSGKTDIPSMLIPVFCEQFGSKALVMALVDVCDRMAVEDCEPLDLTRLCSEAVRANLQHGVAFMDAAEDGHIDGHELIDLNHRTAQIRRNTFRLLETAQRMRHRRQTDAPAAA